MFMKESFMSRHEKELRYPATYDRHITHNGFCFVVNIRMLHEALSMLYR